MQIELSNDSIILASPRPSSSVPFQELRFMKSRILQILPAFLLVFSLFCHADESGPKSSAKVLTIGNSFADDSVRWLPAMAKAGGKQLVLFRANLNVHSLRQHVAYLATFEANPLNPSGSPYKVPATADGIQKKISLREALQSDAWDVVTIQQLSQESPQYETFQPHAGKLIAYIEKHAPQARILIQETWAYSSDCPRYQDPKTPHLKDPETMYQNLKAAYGQLSAESGLGMIRVGDAFHSVMTSPDPIRLHGITKKGKGDIHANTNGQFLGAAMFYEAVFNDSVLNNPFVPSGMTPEVAQRLREVAHVTPIQQGRGGKIIHVNFSDEREPAAKAVGE
jgi:hypothetical protein